jgi:hypothetical protein
MTDVTWTRICSFCRKELPQDEACDLPGCRESAARQEAAYNAHVPTKSEKPEDLSKEQVLVYHLVKRLGFDPTYLSDFILPGCMLEVVSIASNQFKYDAGQHFSPDTNFNKFYDDVLRGCGAIKDEGRKPIPGTHWVGQNY